MVFDLYLNEIQYCPVKKDMTWFELEPEIYAGEYVTINGKFNYNDDLATDALQSVIGIACHDVYPGDTLDVMKIHTGEIVQRVWY